MTKQELKDKIELLELKLRVKELEQRLSTYYPVYTYPVYPQPYQPYEITYTT